jgi:adenylate cyclase
MKGSTVDASVLFVDIRGFTGISEGKKPEVIVELLNDYFKRITDIIMAYGGHLNKFVGDEAMVMFGAPLENPNHARAAVEAARDIQREIQTVFQHHERHGLAIQVGIGINSGEMVAGNLGSDKRMEYTVIGDNVNIASRLTSLAKPGEILMSKNTYDQIESIEGLRVEYRGEVPVRGRKQDLTVYGVIPLLHDPEENENS